MHECISGIHAAAKEGALSQAMAFYEDALAHGVKLPLRVHNTMMYLAVGGDQWEALARGGEPNACAVSGISGADTAAAAPASSEALRAERVDAGTKVGLELEVARVASWEAGRPVV